MYALYDVSSILLIWYWTCSLLISTVFNIPSDKLGSISENLFSGNIFTFGMALELSLIFWEILLFISVFV